MSFVNIFFMSCTLVELPIALCNTNENNFINCIHTGALISHVMANIFLNCKFT